VDAVNISKFEITEIVSGKARGADELGEQWATENGVPIKPFAANWNNLTQPGAVIKINKWDKKYNANAGFYRNQKMAEYADALIAIQVDGDTPGTGDMIKRAKAEGLSVFVYEGPEEKDKVFAFSF
jgi:hypothetical protein